MQFTSDGADYLLWEVDLHIRIHNLHLEPDPESGEQFVIVSGSSPEGPVRAALLDAPTTSLLKQILTSAGPDVLRARLEAESRLWLCMGERQTVDGILRLQVRDATLVASLCEHIRSAVFVSERGEPILVGFPPFVGEGWG